MKSIIQDEPNRCYLCGRPSVYGDPLDKHHVFGGPNRQLSEKYGLTVYLHHNSCHIFGEDSVHTNKEVREKLQWEVQELAMEHYGWSVEDWIKIFGMNYLPFEPDIMNKESDSKDTNS